MSSYSRNTRRANSPLRPRVLGAGLALSLMSGAVLADGAHQFVFTAYSDGAGGAEVVEGRYRAALEELQSRPADMDLDPSSTNTNRCVAYSMTLQWQQARAACDAAVHAASAQRNLPSGWWGWAHESDDDYLAVAYANRAVMEWLSNDEAAAGKDLAAAQALAPDAGYIAKNLAALKVHMVVARAGTPSPQS